VHRPGRRNVEMAPEAAAHASSVFVSELPKPAERMPVVEFADPEIGSADERYGAGMAKYLPERLRARYCRGGALAFNRFTGGNDAIDKIERQRHETSNLCHRSTALLQGQPTSQGMTISTRTVAVRCREPEMFVRRQGTCAATGMIVELHRARRTENSHFFGPGAWPVSIHGGPG
jgi:hypothetical protein